MININYLLNRNLTRVIRFTASKIERETFISSALSGGAEIYMSFSQGVESSIAACSTRGKGDVRRDQHSGGRLIGMAKAIHQLPHRAAADELAANVDARGTRMKYR